MKHPNPADAFKFYGSATIGTKGQFVIPAEAREELDLKEGDKVIIVRAPHGEGIITVKAEIFEAMIGSMQSHMSEIVASLNADKDEK